MNSSLVFQILSFGSEYQATHSVDHARFIDARRRAAISQAYAEASRQERSNHGHLQG